MANDICLHISEFKCAKCGAEWTHSEPIMRTDDLGYIDLACPAEFDKWMRRYAKVTCYQRRTLLTPICHNCTDLVNLPSSWPAMQPKELPHAKRKESLSHEDLEALLRT